MKSRYLISVACLIVMALFIVSPVQAQKENQNQDVMKAFTEIEEVESEHLVIPDQKKRLIMFIMGVPLLILILITGGLGVAMGVYGKQVFVPHMVFAGLSMTLALGHAVVGIVWFFPF